MEPNNWCSRRRVLQKNLMEVSIMITYSKIMDINYIHAIQENENNIYYAFQDSFKVLYSNILLKYDIHYNITLHRWTDTYAKWPKKKYDGYNTLLEIDFLNNKNSIIELDENICSFFENITTIYYMPFRRKYRIYQTNNLTVLWEEIKNSITMLEKN